MTGDLGAGEALRLRALVAQQLGLHFDDGKLGMLGELLAQRVRATSLAPAAYLARLETQAPADELRALARELTVGETYFFRHAEQFRAFSEIALPDLMPAGTPRRLRLLSAGCASGEEAYSLAILAHARGLEPGQSVMVRAVDLNGASLERAARGHYSAWSFRETPAELHRRWFVADRAGFAVDPMIRGEVTFEERNLAREDAELWIPESYDVVFCRNVLMYFTPEAAQAAVARIARALVPGGYLFLGHAETLRGLSQDFHLRHTHDAYYYQRKPALQRFVAEPPPPRPSIVTAPIVTGDASSWIETIHRASERIRTLTEPTPGATASAAPRRAELGDALALLERERYDDALALLEAIPAEPRDPDVLLLRAILLTHSGRVETAERVCAQLLALDELSAGAHYVLALCRESFRDADGAVEHDQVAAYLDPTFAMPRLHLGLLARRCGDGDRARRELGQAVLLLQREDASRLLLFGGGFRREALIALCRAELAAAGGGA